MDMTHVVWRKSRRSTGNGGQCVEVGTWRTSSRSTQEGHCVEVAFNEALVLARDSKDPGGPVLGFAPDAWNAFLGTAKTGRFDLPR
ncbi:DUF397 domain-containing protein [Actinomadura sp. WMMB 499]|uniref:DUF397 domain-containing protein n=1 Tax=Actinomadura sp. WMMB 499 TaxID=1219491 RepID=UPI0012466643|nr:DUF397 domain-containing protein [Actinomadura sp. WMMB 499]QFG21910.1 DUF397 domain-containing protein [Actinomadura sp. WMMB 499]